MRYSTEQNQNMVILKYCSDPVEESSICSALMVCILTGLVVDSLSTQILWFGEIIFSKICAIGSV